jgi:nitrate/nitrite transporter NarK
VSIGQLGGFLGSTLIGVLKERTGDYSAAMAVIGLMLLVAAAIVLLVGRSMAPRRAPASAGA